MSPELIIFDCDGVLVDSEPISSRLVAEQLTDLGLPISAAAYEQRFAGTSLSKVMAFFEKETGKSVPDNFEETYRQRSWLAFENELQAIDGVREVLTALSVPKCVASNGPRVKIDFNLRVTELTHFFGASIFSAYDIQRWKPLPDLYLYAAEKMNTLPQKCLVIEDSIHGVEAALAADMPVLGYAKDAKAADQLKKAGATVIENMRQVLDWV